MLQVVAGDVLAHGAAEPHELARRDDHLEAHHPRTGDAVLVRVRPARVRRDVAADLGLLGRAGIWCEEEPALARHAPHLGRPEAGLDLDAPEERIEGAHAVEPLERQHDSAVERDGTTRIARTAAARNDRHSALVAPGDDLGDFLCRPRQRNRVGATVEPTRLGHVRQVCGGRRGHVCGDRSTQIALD
ncbi:MAG: hypothetical protein AUG91_01160 [Actinobacteria bacterium 13_1_20CM_4_69_9]|nr:MAG: hypothetical protein AUG91_01160 [Actinobacteria bacterium 13_1_20CM_4_69_9]